MKYIGQCLEFVLDHTNMPNFHLSSRDGHTTPYKNPKMCAIVSVKNLKVSKTE